MIEGNREEFKDERKGGEDGKREMKRRDDRKREGREGEG